MAASTPYATNEVENLACAIETNVHDPYVYGNKEEFVTILRGAPETDNPYFPGTWKKVPSFESVSKHEQNLVEATVRHVERDIKELTTRIDSWVQIWES